MKQTLLLLFTLIFQISFGQTSHTVYASNFEYTPSSLTITVGDEVVWINEQGFHDVNGDINSITDEPFNNPETFDSPSVSSGVIYAHTFNLPGVYNYDCSVGSHALNGMVGQIIVEGETTVVDVIVNSENHTTLETAVVTAGLVETLSGEGPFTVFAPTDDAFNGLPEGTLDAVLADMDLLTSILTHHVAGGTVYSTDLSDGMMVTTLNGTELMVTIDENGVMIDNAMVTVADIEADNGVVHVIDAVLIPENEPYTVVDIIVDSENHNTLETAVVAAGLVETLSGEGPFTVFAPTDDAFDGLPEGTLDAVLADMELLTSILTHHVVGGSIYSTDLADGMMVTTLNGTELMVTIDGNGVMIDNAMVTVADIEADNGVVHVIDAVLIPENECEDDNETIDQLFGAMFISDCEALVEFLMTNYNYSEYQACSWDGQPMFSLETTVGEICECACQDVEEETMTVVDIIANSENHNTLEYALGEAGFIEYLSGEGPFTVFAPTDDAFDALPEGTLDAVLTDFELLASILKYHVVTGSVYSTDLSDGMMVTTLEGSDLTVTIDENGVMINDAMVTVADIEADNGVVHVIDAVLIPENDPYTVVDVIVDSESHNTLETAVVTAELVETLSGEGPFTVFAPTDDAFNALPEGTLDAVLTDMDLLTSILTHHVAGGSVYSTDLSDGMMVTTLNGTELMVTIDDNGVMIDNAMVTVADIEADNGVVHVIDAVLIPESSNINENLIMNDDKLLYRVDQLGRRIKSEHGLIIELYESGRNVKKYKIK